ncbi:MAG: type II toxin-antitoxin system CcdA family antitoxin [Nitrospirae bacterium]|uniref:type II toxin-antitoxin system CcdA family antitoxin n=1 Tax=Candidatus Magnetobacterium casense TaxID=1455061 RepID=UPI00058B9FF9|nr:type II toxin-antitoxin system CcdA family antitoxin [Candidatus Magnetobacterium casensis]MBF0336881.1 type II toxin-antitoxin system CcdA family antitoxin [Nitrospirota bacterium]
MIRTSVTLPEELIEEVRQYSDNFSSFVAIALRQHIRRKKIELAMQSFGKWTDRERESVDIVNELRKDRDYGSSFD